MKRPRAMGLVAVSAAATLPLLTALPLGASAAQAAQAPSQVREGIQDHSAPAPASPARHRVVAGSLHRASTLFAGAKTNGASAPKTAAWLPKGCKLVEIGPASTGYAPAPACYVKGIAVPNGYMLVRGAVKAPVNAKTGASG